MSVHKAISKHVNGQNQILNDFVLLEQQREAYIDEACTLCKQGQPFSTEKINEVTKKMNKLSNKIENLPERLYVSVPMVQEFVSKLSQK
ncbi:YpbS family protein [Bacillus sp. 1NLA3E]|uniref:YpbS family protein n=1 Tax=Bacillus sp. 1NLA3E TaxID=666686 RepID=UPI000247ECC2|nr:YpbS family protein [Bacillus sp. 1NLA3E]AGK54235.1 hypothetical protein B1NLA3E_12435 [Bacillus sp. 1NLA3E]